jgi:hypothetical protein
MSFQVVVGSFAAPTSTGNQSYTGLSFTPSLVLFNICTTNTSVGTQAAITYTYGAASSSSNQWWVGGAASNATTDFTAEQWYDETYCVGVVNTSGTVVAKASLSSFNNNGWTLDWAAVGSAYIVNFIAFGGLTDAYCSYFTTTTSTGNFSVSGVGFTPDIVFVMPMQSTQTPPTTSAVAQFKFGMGAFNSSTQGCTVETVDVGSDTSYTYQRAEALAASTSSGGASNDATWVSMNSSGFTLDFTVADFARSSYYIALKGVKSAIGTLTQPSSTGNQTISGLSFNPSLLMLFSANKASSTSITTPAFHSFGAATSSNQFASWLGLSSGSTTVSTSADIDQSNVIKMYTPNGASPTLNAAASLSSFGTGSFTLDWTTTNSTGAEVWYVAIASASNAYTNTQTASMGKFSGAPVKKIEKSPSAHMSMAGKTQRSTGLPFAGAMKSFAGVVGRQAGKAVKAFSNLFGGALTKTIDKTPSAQMSLSAKVTKGTSLPTAGGMATFSGKTARTTGRALTAATKSFAGTITRNVAKGITGATNLFNGVIGHARPIFISATMSFFKPAVTKQTDRKIEATPRHLHGAVQRVVSQGFAATMTAFAGFTGRVTGKRIAPIMASFKAKVKKSTSIPLAGVMSFFHGLQNYGQAYTMMLTANMQAFVATLRRATSKETSTALHLQPKLQRTITKSAFEAFMKLMSGSTVKTFATTINTAAINFTGNAKKRIQKALGSSIQFKGFISRTRPVLLTAKQSFRALVTRNTSTTTSASLPTLSGKTKKQTGKSLSASMSFSGTVIKNIRARVAAAMQTFSGKVTTGRLAVVNIVASLSSFGGSVVRYAHKAIKPTLRLSPTLTKATTVTPFDAPVTFDANTNKHTSRAWTSAAIGFTGSTARNTFRTFKTSVKFVATLSKSTSRAIVGAVTFNAGITKRISASITATFAVFTHSFSRFTSVALKSPLRFSPALTKLISQHPLTASTHTFGAKLKKQTSILAQAAMNPFSGLYGRAKAKVFSASMNTLSAGVVRQTDKQVTAKNSFSGSIGRQIPYLISGAMSAMSARLTRGIAKTLTASTQPMSSGMVRRIGKAIRSAWTTFKSTFGLSSFVLPKYRTIHAPYRRSIIVARRQQTVVARYRKYIIQAK